MKNKYILVLPLLLLFSASAILFTSKPVINDSLDPETCNCSGPKASKLNLDNNLINFAATNFILLGQSVPDDLAPSLFL